MISFESFGRFLPQTIPSLRVPVLPVFGDDRSAGTSPPSHLRIRSGSFGVFPEVTNDRPGAFAAPNDSVAHSTLRNGRVLETFCVHVTSWCSIIFWEVLGSRSSEACS